jgi:hypothetical protein
MQAQSEEMAPEVAQQRTVLDALIAGYKEAGFTQQMEALALEAQNPGNSDIEKKKHAMQVAEKRGLSKNMYAAAARLVKEREALPGPDVAMAKE